MIPHHVLRKYESKPVWIVNKSNHGFRGVLECVGSTHIEVMLIGKSGSYDGRVAMDIDGLDYMYIDDPATTKLYCEFLAAQEEPIHDVVFQSQE